MGFFQQLLQAVFRLGYLGPLVLGTLDSSFLVLPFGNDLVVFGLVAQNHRGAVWYVLSAACGSTIGAFLLALVSRKLGETSISHIAGERRYLRLKNHIGKHGGVAIAVGGLAPPPFPFTTVVAGAAALKYPLPRMLVVNFLARGTRFTALAFLAFHFGVQVLRFENSAAFKWTMAAFIAGCLVASGFSIAHWLRKPH